MKRGNYILWLPSWYPNKLEPYNGDFIQRHAKAAALYDSIAVIFFTEYGEKVKCAYDKTEQITEGLKETVFYVPFRPLGLPLLDRLLYNFTFYRFSKKKLLEFFEQNGLPSLVHVHVPVKSGNLALWIRRKFDVPYIVSEQASTYLKEAPDYFLTRHPVYRQQVRKIFSLASAVTNVSEAIGKILRQLFGVKVQVIHNVVDTTLFYYDSMKPAVFTYIHVSSLTRQKNIEGILNAFKQMAQARRDWQLVLVGPGSDLIKKFIENERLSELIVLTGEVSYAEVAQLMKRAHAMVLYSNHENFPCVVVEALCCGLPVVAANVAGVNEAVNEMNGILVEPGDDVQLLNSLFKVRKNYQEYNRVAISKKASEQFCYKAIGEQFHNLYSQVKIGIRRK
jgi:glycosyltransferase involved in cell wall biosynthesis